MSIKIVCDSTAYIPRELLEKYDIDVVSLNIIFEDESFREVDINQTTFYKKLKDNKQLPTSAQPTISEMYDSFEKKVRAGDMVVGVFMSSDMSGTYSSAHLVKAMIIEKYPEAVIEIVDSRSNSMQLGFVALAAAEKAFNKGSMEEVLSAAANVIEKSRFLFVPDTLEYLRKGGRMGGASALIGMILQIRPVLTVFQGKTNVLDKVRTKKKAIDRIVEIFMNDVEKKGLEKVIVHNIDCEEEGIELSNRIERLIGMKVEIYPIGPVIGLHTGPGAIGIVYYLKN
ncbi:MAG: DegV family protein [Clostridiaceae bacterium]|nr:DegV family protein [Clostridiaceae bacterium]